MSMQQPIAKVTKLDTNTFKVEMMPTEKIARFVKSGEKAFEDYLKAFPDMKIGDNAHVTELP